MFLTKYFTCCRYSVFDRLRLLSVHRAPAKNAGKVAEFLLPRMHMSHPPADWLEIAMETPRNLPHWIDLECRAWSGSHTAWAYVSDHYCLACGGHFHKSSVERFPWTHAAHFYTVTCLFTNTCWLML